MNEWGWTHAAHSLFGYNDQSITIVKRVQRPTLDPGTEISQNRVQQIRCTARRLVHAATSRLDCAYGVSTSGASCRKFYIDVFLASVGQQAKSGETLISRPNLDPSVQTERPLGARSGQSVAERRGGRLGGRTAGLARVLSGPISDDAGLSLVRVDALDRHFRSAAFARW
jgi:hypothetical protein